MLIGSSQELLGVRLIEGGRMEQLQFQWKSANYRGFSGCGRGQRVCRFGGRGIEWLHCRRGMEWLQIQTTLSWSLRRIASQLASKIAMYYHSPVTKHCTRIPIMTKKSNSTNWWASRGGLDQRIGDHSPLEFVANWLCSKKWYYSQQTVINSWLTSWW